MGATQCIVRFIYWFQLNEKIGPIVMNISRVFLDIMSFTSIYTLIVSAFTSGLVFVLTSDHFYHLNNGTYIEIGSKVGKCFSIGITSGLEYGNMCTKF